MSLQETVNADNFRGKPRDPDTALLRVHCVVCCRCRQRDFEARAGLQPIIDHVLLEQAMRSEEIMLTLKAVTANVNLSKIFKATELIRKIPCELQPGTA